VSREPGGLGGIVEQDGADVLIRVKAVPGASRNGITGRVGDRLKVRVSAPPEGGRANKAICAVVAEVLGLRPNRVSVDGGRTSADKTLRITNARAATIAQHLTAD